MVGTEPDSDAGYCKFPNVRKTYWRSASWATQSPPLIDQSPPLVSNSEHVHAGDEESGYGGYIMEESRPRLYQPHNNRARPVPQPLCISKKNFDEWPMAALDDMTDWNIPATPGRRRVKVISDIKLDLASVQRSAIEPTEIQLKRDKFAHFDKQCSRVGNHHIYLGSDAVARDREILLANGITHVLNCVGFVCPEYYKQDFVYKTLWLQDSPCEDITSLLYDVFDYFEEVKEQGGRVLVHCCQGVSRSTSLVIAYLMWKEHRSFEDAFHDVKAARGVTNPNMGFACQLLQCQKRVHATPMSPNSMVRMYRLAPHSPYDPLHLVPKALNNPGAGALDSRAAFVVHGPSAIFVWIGKDCDSKMGLVAKAAAGQIVRYESAKGPISFVVEGEEGIEFWKLLEKDSGEANTTVKAEFTCSLEQSTQAAEIEKCRKTGIGNKRVSVYDADLDLYHIAHRGGVLPPVPSTIVDIAAKPTYVPVRDDGWSMLQHKFFSRDLVILQETEECKDIIQSNLAVISPDISMSSSSPHFSPFSGTALTTSDSAFASPLSLSNFPSPAVRGLVTPSVMLADSDLPPLCPLHVYGLPRLSRSKSPSSSLAERRGSTRLTLKLSSISDDPPSASRSMLRQVRLSPLVVMDNSRSLTADEGCMKSCSGPKDDSVEMCNTRSRKAVVSPALDDVAAFASKLTSFTDSFQFSCSSKMHSILYTWPDLEKIDMFDIEDLDTKAVYLLYVSYLDKNDHHTVVYIWVGQEFWVEGTESTSIFDEVGRSFLEQMLLPEETLVEVVREGQEPDEFWDYFKNG